MMINIKIWLLNRILNACRYLLVNRDAADSQNELNEVIAIKNYCSVNLKRLNTKEKEGEE